jgi:hypothetical protein
MKRLLLAAVLVLLPVALFAQTADRDVLLAGNGTLYIIESVQADDVDLSTMSSQYLSLTIQNGDHVTRTVVPESMLPGTHSRPALAYDAGTDSLFVFWQKQPNAMSSELLFASYHNGQWQPATSIDDAPFHYRFNLRIGTSRRVSQLQKDGTYADVPALLVHAVWWEESPAKGEVARYALLTIENGTVTSIDLHDLNEFTAGDTASYNVSSDFNADILKHPAIIDTPSADSVDVIFGDTTTNAFHRVTLKPVADSRIRIPVGRDGGHHLPGPASFTASWPGRIGTISSGRDNDHIALYNVGRSSISYIVYAGGKWSDVKTVPTSDRLSADGAVAVLTRMLDQ